MSALKTFKVLVLPGTPEPNALYYVLDVTHNVVGGYLTDAFGVAYPLAGMASILAIAGDFVPDTFTPTPGQTVFNLTYTPHALSLFAFVNGQQLDYGVDFTLSGSTVTILSALGYTLSPTDKVMFRYLKA